MAQSLAPLITILPGPSAGGNGQGVNLLITVGGAAGPILLSAAMVSGRLVLTWLCSGNAGLLGTDDARNPANYSVTAPGGQSMQVTDVQLVEGQTTVSLGVTGEFRTGGTFTANVVKGTVRDNIAGSGNLVSSIPFTVIGPTFKVGNAVPQSSTKLRVTFTRPAKQVSAGASDDALRPANYAITWAGGSLAVSSVATVSPDTVDLTTASELPGVLYTLTASNIKDLAGNVITP